jgi:pimeloyl-ACP methyl ester carboxylesterase
MIALIDHLHLESCQVVGFLSGAAFALRLAERFPDRIARLMLVAGRPPAPMRGRFRHLMPLWEKMTSHPWLLTSFFNILRNRASEETNARLIRSVYGSVPHDLALLESRPDIFQHMVAYTLESLTVTAGGVAGELKCFARTEAEALPRLDMPITAWHGAADNLAGLEDLEQYLSAQLVNWRLFPEAGSLILFEHRDSVLKTLAGAEV